MIIGTPLVPASSPCTSLGFSRDPLVRWSGQPVFFGLGDPRSGPLVGIIGDAPATPAEMAAGPVLAPPHGHPSDSFRVCLRGELVVGRDRYPRGAFRFQDGAVPYGRDGDLPHEDGNWRVLVFADRRGYRIRPTNPELRRSFAANANAERHAYGLDDIVPEPFDDDEDGIQGMNSTLGPAGSLGNVDGSYATSDQWERLPSGQRVAVGLLGDTTTGAIVILLRTPAGVTSSGDLNLGTDTFRMIVRGGTEASAATSYEREGDMVLRAADDPSPPVVAGPDGLDEALLLADRRHLLGRTTEDRAEDGWPAHVARMVRELPPRSSRRSARAVG
jgi:hypothetical protein